MSNFTSDFALSSIPALTVFDWLSELSVNLSSVRKYTCVAQLLPL